MNWDVVQKHIDFLNENYPLGNEGKEWELSFQHYHFYNNNDLAYSINKLISISKEQHTAKDALADLTFKTLILRIIQTQHLVAIDQPNHHPDLFQDTIDYIHNNIERDLSIDILAQKSGMNKSAFFKTFKLAFGLTPLHYIHKKRLDKAMLLLKTTQMNINEIAFECGFYNVHYFCRLFKKHFQYSPS